MSCWQLVLIKWLANFISTEFSKRTYPTYCSIILLSVLISPSFFPEHFFCIFSNYIICSIVESRCLTELCCFDRFCMLSTRQQGRLPLSFYSPRDLPPKRSRTSSVLLPSFSGMMYEHLLYMTRLPFILFKLFCSVFTGSHRFNTCFRSTPIYLKNT